MNATAILLTAEEARRFERERPAAARIIALSPVARAALSEDSRRLVIDEPLSDYAHARVLARAHRAFRRFNDSLTASRRLRAGTLHGLRFTFLLHAYLVSRIWATLRGGGPWLIPAAQGWLESGDREEVLARLADHLGPERGYSRRPPLPFLFALLRRAVTAILRRRGPWVLSRNQDLIFGLHDRILERDPAWRILVFRIMGQGLWEYRNLLQTLRDGLSKKRAVRLAVLGDEDEGAHAVLNAAMEAIGDPVLAAGLTEAMRAHLRHQAGNAEGLFEDGKRAIGALRPRGYVTRQDSGQFAAIADAAGACGVPRFAVNYNSLPVSDSAIAREVLEELFRVRMPQGLSDHHAMWSPHIAAMARRVYDPEIAERIRPLRIAPVAVNGVGAAGRPRRVLYAGNYSEYAYFVPWVMETSNELLGSIESAVEAVLGLENVELTIRNKPKRELAPDTLRAFFTESDRLRITGTERPFEQAMAENDLLISFSSTTIEEAILRRTPVLLWGPTKRYLHLPARTTPPSANSRSAVYAVAEASELRPMIGAILDAHAGQPLTDEEIADHVWPESTPGVAALADVILGQSEPTRAAARGLA